MYECSKVRRRWLCKFVYWYIYVPTVGHLVLRLSPYPSQSAGRRTFTFRSSRSRVLKKFSSSRPPVCEQCPSELSKHPFFSSCNPALFLPELCPLLSTPFLSHPLSNSALRAGFPQEKEQEAQQLFDRVTNAKRYKGEYQDPVGWDFDELPDRNFLGVYNFDLTHGGVTTNFCFHTLSAWHGLELFRLIVKDSAANRSLAQSVAVRSIMRRTRTTHNGVGRGTCLAALA